MDVRVAVNRIFNERHIYDYGYAMSTDSDLELVTDSFSVEDVHVVRRSSVLHLAKRFDVDGRYVWAQPSLIRHWVERLEGLSFVSWICSAELEAHAILLV